MLYVLCWLAGDVTGETDEKKAPAGGGRNRDRNCHDAGGAASADDQLDQAFLKALKDNGVAVKTDEMAPESGAFDMRLLNNGGSVNDALSMLSEEDQVVDAEVRRLRRPGCLRLLQGQASRGAPA